MSDGKKLFKQFKEHSIAEFFKKNRQMLGFSGKIRSLTMIVHEFVTNSLDACEESEILPEISVSLEEIDKSLGHYRLHITDNGPGIPKTHIGKALGQMLAGTKFHRYLQQRGQQGIGASACTMFSFLTTGKPTLATSHHRGNRFTAEISIDFKRNRPIINIISEEQTEEHGLEVTAEFKNVKYERSNYGAFEYLRRTALANPHTTISFTEPNGKKTVFPRSVEKNPPRPYEIKPHPLGISAHDLLELSKNPGENRRLSSFLQNSFSRLSAKKVSDLKDLLPDINFNMNPRRLDWGQSEKIVNAFKKVKWIAPQTDSLVPIGKERVEASFVNLFNPDVVFVSERAPKVFRGGIPFMVEAGIAYGGGVSEAGKRGEIMRFANKVPLLFDTSGCAITETVKGIDWKRYSLRNFEDEPVAVLVNLVSVHVPYTSAGKQAISSEEEIKNEMKFAVMEAARGVQRYLSGKRKAKEIATKRKVLSRYVGQLSSDLSIITGKSPDRIEKKLRSLIEHRYEKKSASGEGDVS